MTILVLNCGSSSVKYQLIDTSTELALAKGSVSRIGMSASVVTHKPHDRNEVKISAEILDHIQAVEYVLSMLMSPNHGVIARKEEIDAVGHRVVHGGEEFSDSVLITQELKATLRGLIELAPLHNPHNIRGINACPTRITFAVSTPARPTCPKCLRLPSLTLPFTIRCRRMRMSTGYRTCSTSGTVYVDTAFTGPPIAT
jgi:acetate kinase